MLTLLVKLYPQFHPRSALEERAVVLANKNTPVKTGNVYMHVTKLELILRVYWSTHRLRQRGFPSVQTLGDLLPTRRAERLEYQ